MMMVLGLLLENLLLTAVVILWALYGAELFLARLRYELKRRYG